MHMYFLLQCCGCRVGHGVACTVLFMSFGSCSCSRALRMTQKIQSTISFCDED